MSNRSASLVKRAIQTISAGPVSAVLRPLGFRSRSTHFWREIDGLFHAVNFQASQWGSHDHGRFTINLGVSLPPIYSALTGRDFPANPGTALWPVNERIGRLLPEQTDLWWEVTPDTDMDELGPLVAATVRDYALPFFQHFASATALHGALVRGDPIPGVLPAHRSLISAALHVQRGQHIDASLLIHEALRESVGTPFVETIRAVASKIGVAADGA